MPDGVTMRTYSGVVGMRFACQGEKEMCCRAKSEVVLGGAQYSACSKAAGNPELKVKGMALHIQAPHKPSESSRMRARETYVRETTLDYRQTNVSLAY